MRFSEILEGDITDLDNPVNGIIYVKEKRRKQLIQELVEFMNTTQEWRRELYQRFKEQCKEVGLEKKKIIRKLPDKKKMMGRVVEALGDLLLRELFEVDILVSPWARYFSEEQPLPSFDGIGITKHQKLLIYEAKASSTEDSYRSGIRKIFDDQENKDKPTLYNDITKYLDHYKTLEIMKKIKEALENREVVTNDQSKFLQYFSFLCSSNIVLGFNKKLQERKSSQYEQRIRDFELLSISNFCEIVYQSVFMDLESN